jgi:hypothetical protein
VGEPTVLTQIGHAPEYANITIELIIFISNERNKDVIAWIFDVFLEFFGC